MRPMFQFATTLALSALLATSAAADDWGTLSFRLVYDGDAPTPAPIRPTQDAAFCGQHNLVDESLVVNESNGGIRDVVVVLFLARGAAAPEAHPDYAELAEQEVLLDNENCRFAPRVVTVRTGQTLILGNSDPIGHNSNVATFDNPSINPIIPAGSQVRHVFAAAERMPTRVSCNIHPWMAAWVVVRDHPYMAASDEDGRVEIKNLPAGKWTFQVWQEKAGFVTDVKRNGRSERWARGQFEVTVGAGENDLGEILVDPANFRR